ncbi:hypothetical protein PP1_006640 [Pseudonocardia sp. P1]
MRGSHLHPITELTSQLGDQLGLCSIGSDDTDRRGVGEVPDQLTEYRVDLGRLGVIAPRPSGRPADGVTCHVSPSQRRPGQPDPAGGGRIGEHSEAALVEESVHHTRDIGMAAVVLVEKDRWT